MPDVERYCLWLVDGGGVVIDTLMGTGDTACVTLPIDAIAALIVRKQPRYLFLAHSHPSGDPRPSQEDIVTTRLLWRMARLIGVSLQDHVIVASGGRFSFRDEGLT